MGKKNKSSSGGSQQRQRFNYITGQTEIVAGTKAGKRRTRLPYGHPLRTHDLENRGKRKGHKRNEDNAE